jgi:acetyl-CoA carboxylase carboxyltransferase component
MESTRIARVVASGPGAQVAAQGSGLVPVNPILRPILGGTASGFHYQPALGDLIIVARGQGGLDIIVGAYLNPFSGDTLTALQPGESALLHPTGSYVKLTALGDIALVPAAGRSVLLGAGAGAVARSGDAVSVNTTTGLGTITGAGSPSARA